MSAIDRFLGRCRLADDLRTHVRAVLQAMPAEVVHGLVGDEGFVVTETAGRGGFVLPVPSARRPTRAVVLKRRMWRSDEGFVRWVIAHELAHAHLHNGGRHPGEDPEHAADALAAEWGFARPPRGE